MNLKTPFSFLIIIIFIFFSACDSQNHKTENRVVIGISADVQTFNPLFAFSVDEGVITELLYLSLFDFRWNNEKGELDSYPMLAERWEWAPDSSHLKIFLRKDAFWTDGEQITSADVVFSFDVFSDPVVQSRMYGNFRNLYFDNENHINIKKTFTIISPYELQVNFPPSSIPSLDDLSSPVLPQHYLEKINREELATSESNLNPVSNGAYKLTGWDKNQAITLSADTNSFLFKDGMIAQLVFKIIPDYTSRILQLKKGELDMLELVKVEDVDEIKQVEDLRVTALSGREYDYIGWNNIDPVAYGKGKIIPNELFGNSRIRKALTFAVNRKEILEEYLQNYGQLAVTSVSPIFKSAYNNDIKPYDFNVDKAKDILTSEGWKDNNHDGVLEKDGNDFRFTLYYPAGNPLRDFASTVIRNNLKAVGIEMDVQTMELNTFIDNLVDKKMDAWMAAWYIPIPVDLKNYWYSDLEATPRNFVSYQNKEVDKIIERLETKISGEKRNELIKKFQAIIHEDEPVTFLYWTPDICAYNKKIKNINITPLGAIMHCWEWTFNQ